MIQDIFPHKYDVTYKHPDVKETDILLIFSGTSLLCSVENGETAFPAVSDILPIYPDAEKKAEFLFEIDSICYFELRSPGIATFGKWKYLSKEEFRAIKPVWHSFAAITAYQIHSWYSNNCYCGCCGKPMCPSETERAMVCKSCKRTVYPQICPSVIVGVTDGDRLLLTRYAASHSKYRRFSLVAGYTEVGESLEDTVRREVMEEVGLKVKNIRYYKSQPWSFSDSLLVGFFCEADGNTEVTLDTNELSEAVWLTRDEIPEESADTSVSLTGTMIHAFKYTK